VQTLQEEAIDTLSDREVHMTNAISLRSRIIGNYYVRFWSRVGRSDLLGLGVTNIEDELSVSLKRYDENRYDASGEEYNEEDIENRPVLRELFADIKDGVVDTVVVYSMAILSTKLKTVDKIARIFKEHGVRLILASEGVDTLMPSGRRFFLHLSNLVNYESLGDKKEYFKTKDEENV